MNGERTTAAVIKERLKRIGVKPLGPKMPRLFNMP
jgi:hypothetical protein